MEVNSNSPRETQKIAQNLAKILKGGEVIALYGELGAGKTVFVKGLALGLSIKKRITSPTFVYIKSYPIKLGQKPLIFHHLDLWRITSRIDIKSLALDELFSKESIIVFEWADKIAKDLPKKRIEVIITTKNAKQRKIKIKRT